MRRTKNARAPTDLLLGGKHIRFETNRYYVAVYLSGERDVSVDASTLQRSVYFRCRVDVSVPSNFAFSDLNLKQRAQSDSVRVHTPDDMYLNVVGNASVETFDTTLRLNVRGAQHVSVHNTNRVQCTIKLRAGADAHANCASEFESFSMKYSSIRTGNVETGRRTVVYCHKRRRAFGYIQWRIACSFVNE